MKANRFLHVCCCRIEFSVIDASVDAVRDQAEREYLLSPPTTLVPAPEAVDRLRAAAAQILRELVAYRKLVHDLSARKQDPW